RQVRSEVAETEFVEHLAEALDKKPEVALDFFETDCDVVGSRLSLVHYESPAAFFSAVDGAGKKNLGGRMALPVFSPTFSPTDAVLVARRSPGACILSFKFSSSRASYVERRRRIEPASMKPVTLLILLCLAAAAFAVFSDGAIRARIL